MYMRSLLLSWGLATLALGNALAEGPNLGKPIDPSAIAAWNSDIEPDGAGLPAGSGTSAQGSSIFSAKCALCHGEGGRGGVFLGQGAPAAPALVDDKKVVGINEATVTIANYWPYATTLFDYIRRAMPWTQPRSLTNEEVYGLTAYILSLNKLIGANDTMNAQTLPKVRMPNRDGFIVHYPDKI